jgi:hypothetical protein
MTAVDFFFLDLFDPFFIILYLKEFDSAITLHLKRLPFCPVAVLVPANVHAAVISPCFPLSIESPLLVYLNCIVLPSCRSNILFLRKICTIEVCEVALICWSSI